MQDASFLTFIAHADPVVKIVVMILVLASLVSWTIILQRIRLLRKTRRLTQQFEKKFWSGRTLPVLQNEIPRDQSDLSRIFHAGYTEYTAMEQRAHLSGKMILEHAERAMRLASQTCLQRLEQNVSVLATIGSTAPYVGLFGTVWGIMSSFQALGSVQQATIAMVAPGISEALIATAIGLFAAIPAVVGYNRLVNHLDLIQQNYDMFQEALTGIFQQQMTR